MGKDSKLTEYLVSKVTKDFRLIFNNTTCDSAEVYKEVKSHPEIEIITPKDKNGKNLSLYNMVKTIGVPNSAYRWCCSVFKEDNVRKYFKKENDILQFLGMRNEESVARKEYQFEKEDYRFGKTFHFILPIRKWTELELWLYTVHNNISINDLYKKGYRRVGCHIVCPFASKTSWVLDKYWSEKAYKRWHNILYDDFTKGEKWCIHNCTFFEYEKVWNSPGMLNMEPTDEAIKEFMQYKGITDENLAKQYFNKICSDCGKKVYKKNEIAMNMKYFGRNINKFKCKKCLMKDFNWTKDDWNNQVENFKQQGCNLF